MAADRGCRPLLVRSAQWQSHGPIKRVVACAAGRAQAGAWVAEAII